MVGKCYPLGRISIPLLAAYFRHFGYDTALSFISDGEHFGGDTTHFAVCLQRSGGNASGFACSFQHSGEDTSDFAGCL